MSMIKEKLYILNEGDPYKILNIPENATTEEITKVYRKLAKELHPDLYTNAKEAEKEEITYIFTKITSAFNTLKDPEERKKYDFDKKFSKAKRKMATTDAAIKNSAPDIKLNTANVSSPGSINFKDLFTDNKIDAKEIKKKKAADLFSSAVYNYDNGKIDAAIADLQSAIELNPTFAAYHSYLGLVMMKKGWNGYAMAEFKVALNFDPSDPVALKNYVPSPQISRKNIKEENNNNSGLLNRVKNLFKKP